MGNSKHTAGGTHRHRGQRHLGTGIWGACGDVMDDVAGRDRGGEADLYFTQDADPNTVGLGDAPAGEAFDGCADTAYGEAPILDPDQTGQPASRPPGPRPSARDGLPFAGYVFDDAGAPRALWSPPALLPREAMTLQNHKASG